MNQFTQTEKEQATLIFLHIPKTAGTTLKSIIDKQYNQQEIFSFYEY